MKRKYWLIAVSVILFLLILFTISVYFQLQLPSVTGKYTVGRAIFRWVDESRPETLTDDSGDFRELMGYIWYPAKPGTGVKAGYIPDYPAISSGLRQSGELAWLEVFGLRFVRSEHLLGAEPLREDGPFPVILISPGNGTNVEFYSGICAEIASYGYILVGINHPYDVAAQQLSDGTIAVFKKDQFSLNITEHQQYVAERIKVRAVDVSFVLDRLVEVNQSTDSMFAGFFDFDIIAVAGHSLGGITASEVCKVDARFKSCLNYDGLANGGPFSVETPPKPPSQPFAFITKESQLHPIIIDAFVSTDESYWVIIHGAAHDNFTDGPSLQPSILPVPGNAEEYLELINRYSLAYWDKTLKDWTSVLISSSSNQTDVSVVVYPTE